MPLRDVAAHATELARRAGAAEVAASATRSREVTVGWRDGKIETITEATQRGLELSLYVDGRYAEVSTSDLRPPALETFVKDSIELTRALAVDKDRRLPEPELYRDRSGDDLDLVDRAQATVTPDERKQAAAAIEAAARAVPGAAAILSVTTGWSDGWYELERVTSNGFSGAQRVTYFRASGSVTVKDADGRRPADGAYVTARHRADLPPPEAIGREAGERAVGRLGAVKGKSAVLPAVLENRAAGRLVSMLFAPLAASSLQQKRSFLEGKLGKPLGSKRLAFADDPLRRRGLASRAFDAEGLALRPRPIFEDGVLRSYYVDTYYGRKLGIAPTTGAPTNIAWRLGDRDQAALVAGIRDGILITSFIGGNANAATGDFSLGVGGFRIRDGKRAEPVSEMNISGNQLELWTRLSAVGNDPYPWSSARTPTLVFDGIQFAGV
jgi:PmbA protein